MNRRDKNNLLDEADVHTIANWLTKSEALLNFPEGVGTTYLLTQRNEEFVIESQDPDDLLKGLFSFKFSLTYMFVFRNMLKQPI